MITLRNVRTAVVVLLTVVLVAAVVGVARWSSTISKTHVIAYFDNSNGIFAGDEVRILGVRVGAIEKIEPQPQRAKITFWVANKYQVPADAKAVIVAPQLVTSRAIQLTPAYTGGPALVDEAVIPQDRTAVPVEWDDLRKQLEKLTEALQPTQPGGVSTLGAFINTTADNLRGQGANIHDMTVKLSQVLSALGDHSSDLFATIKNLSTLVSALQSSTDVLRQLNSNLASVTGLLASDPNQVGQAVTDLNTAVTEVKDFVAQNRDALGTSFDKLASISQTLHDSLDGIEQALHSAPTALANLGAVYQPAQAALTGTLVLNNFADPISFLCGAVEAASRLNHEQSAKLCVQYLAPILKNRQYNFPPLGENFFIGAQARPNEITYSEDWMRPDHVPDTAPPSPAPPPAVQPGPVAVESPVSSDPAGGLSGLMVPAGGGS